MNDLASLFNQSIQQGLGYNYDPVTVQQKKAQELQQATRAKQQLLAGDEALLDDEAKRALAMGIPLHVVKAEMQQREAMRQMTETDRMANMAAQAKGDENALRDPEMEQDLYNSSQFERALRGRPNAAIDHMQEQRALEAARLAQMSTLQSNDPESGKGLFTSARDMGIAAGKGFTQFGDAIERLTQVGGHKLGLIDDDEFHSQIMNPTGGEIGTQKLTKAQSSVYGMREEAKKYASQLNDYKAENTKRELTKMYGKEEAEKIANKQRRMDDFHDSFIGTEWLKDSVGSQVLPMLLTMVAGKVSASVAAKSVEAVIKLTAKKIAKNSAKQAARNIARSSGGAISQASIDRAQQTIQRMMMAQYGGTINKVIGAGAATGAASYAAFSESMSNGAQSYQAVMAQDTQAVYMSEKGQELAKKYPNKSPKEIQLMMAEDAMETTLMSTGLAISAIQLLGGSTFERALGGVGKAGIAKAGAGAKTKEILSGMVKEAPSEYLEEYATVASQKLATNYSTGMNVYDDPLLGAHTAGVIGAASAGTLGVVAGTPAIAKTAAKGAYDGITSLTNMGSNYVRNRADNTEDEHINSIFGTSAVYDDNGNVVRPSTTGITGATFDESSFGSTWQSIEQNYINQPDSPFAEYQGNSQRYTATLRGMYDRASESQEIIDQANNGQITISPDELQMHQNRVNAFNDIKQSLSDAIAQDFIQYDTEISQHFRANQAAANELQQELAKPNPDPEREKTLLAAAQATEQAYQASFANSEGLQRFGNTQLSAILDVDGNLNDPNVRNMTSDDIDALDLNNPPANLSLPQMYASAKQIKSDLQAGNITVEEANAQMNQLARKVFSTFRPNSNNPKGSLKEISAFAQDYTSVIGLDTLAGQIFSYIEQYLADPEVFEKMSDAHASALLEKFIGTGRKGNINPENENQNSFGNYGLLQYALIANANEGKLPLNMQNNLRHFMNTQRGKLLGINSTIADMHQDILDFKDQGKYPQDADPTQYQFNPPKPLRNVTLKRKSNDDRTTKSGGTAGSENTAFTSLNQAYKYRNNVAQDTELFENLGNAILSGQNVLDVSQSDIDNASNTNTNRNSNTDVNVKTKTDTKLNTPPPNDGGGNSGGENNVTPTTTNNATNSSESSDSTNKSVTDSTDSKVETTSKTENSTPTSNSVEQGTTQRPKTATEYSNNLKKVDFSKSVNYETALPFKEGEYKVFDDDTETYSNLNLSETTANATAKKLKNIGFTNAKVTHIGAYNTTGNKVFRQGDHVVATIKTNGKTYIVDMPQKYLWSPSYPNKNGKRGAPKVITNVFTPKFIEVSPEGMFYNYRTGYEEHISKYITDPTEKAKTIKSTEDAQLYGAAKDFKNLTVDSEKSTIRTDAKQIADNLESKGRSTTDLLVEKKLIKLDSLIYAFLNTKDADLKKKFQNLLSEFKAELYNENQEIWSKVIKDTLRKYKNNKDDDVGDGGDGGTPTPTSPNDSPDSNNEGNSVESVKDSSNESSDNFVPPEPQEVELEDVNVQTSKGDIKQNEPSIFYNSDTKEYTFPDNLQDKQLTNYLSGNKQYVQIPEVKSPILKKLSKFGLTSKKMVELKNLYRDKKNVSDETAIKDFLTFMDSQLRKLENLKDVGNWDADRVDDISIRFAKAIFNQLENEWELNIKEIMDDFSRLALAEADIEANKQMKDYLKSNYESVKDILITSFGYISNNLLPDINKANPDEIVQFRIRKADLRELPNEAKLNNFVDISRDYYTVNIPVSYLNEMELRGYSLTGSLLAENGSFRNESKFTVLPQSVLDTATQDIPAGIKPEDYISDSQMQEAYKALGVTTETVTPKQMGELILALRAQQKLVSEMFTNPDIIPQFAMELNKGQKENGNYLPNIATVNALSAFIRVERGADGRLTPMIHPKVIQALVGAMNLGIAEGSVFGSESVERTQDYIKDDLKANNYTVVDDTLYSRSGNDDRFKQGKFAPTRVERGEPALGQLGVPKQRMQQMLGKNFLDLMGYRFNRNTPDNIRTSQERAIGFELYNLLLRNGLIAEHSLIYTQGDKAIPRNEDGSLDFKAIDEQASGVDSPIKIQGYANFTWNVDEVPSLNANYETVKGGKAQINNSIIDFGNKSMTMSKVFRILANPQRTSSKGKASFTEKLEKELGEFDDINGTNYLPFVYIQRAMTSSGLGEVLYQTDMNELKGVWIYSKQEIYAGDIKTPKASAEDVDNRLTTGQNYQIIENLDTKNTVPFVLNMNLLDDLMQAPVLIKTFFGEPYDVADADGRYTGSTNIDKALVSSKTKESLRGKGIQSTRAFDTLRDLVRAGLEGKIAYEDLVFFMRNKQTRNSRNYQKSVVTPQSDKVLREFVVAAYREVDKDGNITRIFTPSMTLEPSTEPRSFDNMMNGILASKNNLENADLSKLQDDIGMVLAVAQALGIKVEKLTIESVISQLQEKLKSPQIEYLRKTQWEIIKQSKGLQANVPSQEVMVKMGSDFSEKYGTDAPRLYNALRTVTMYENENAGDAMTNESVEFSPNLYLEADGVSNAYYNLNRQFTAGMTSSYLQMLKRTGNLSLDVLANMYFNELVSEGDTELTPQQVFEKQQALDYLTDSRLNNSEHDTSMEDVYQVLASSLASEMVKALKAIRAVSYVEGSKKALNTRILNMSYTVWKNTENAIEEELLDIVSSEGKGFPDENSKKALNTLKNNLRIFSQLFVMGFVDSNTTNQADMEQAVLNFFRKVSKGKDSNQQTLQYGFSKAEIHLSRGLAKTAATPSGYGGELDGITNQVSKEFLPSLYGLVDEFGKIYEDALEAGINNQQDVNRLAQNIVNQWEKFQTILMMNGAVPFVSKDLIAKTQVDESIRQKEDADIDPAEDLTVADLLNDKSKLNEYLANFINNPTSSNARNQLLKFMDALVDHIESQKGTLIRSLKSGLATKMHSTIQFEFNELFSNIKYNIALDTVRFIEFEKEFQRRYEQRVEQRNRDNNYAPNNPRRFDKLSKDEIKDIFKSMQNLPVIATAFSNNNYLLERLSNEGMSVIGQERVYNDNKASLVSNIPVRNNPKDGLLSVQEGYNFRTNDGRYYGYSRNMTSIIFEELMRYEPAGASNTTSTVVSLESATMSEAFNQMLNDGVFTPAELKEAEKNGTLDEVRKIVKGALDVFDGLDAHFMDREVLSSMLNQKTHEAHLGTNLIESYFHANNRGTLQQTAEKFDNDPLIQAFLSESIEEAGSSHYGYPYSVEISNHTEAEAMILALSLHRQSLEARKQTVTDRESFEIMLQAIQAVSGFQNQVFDIYRSESGQGVLEILSEEQAINEDPVLGGMRRNTFANAIDSVISNSPNENGSFASRLNSELERHRDMAAKAEAVKAIEAKILPAIIVQFAGSGKGYFHNKDSFFDENSPVRRYMKFLEIQGAANAASIDFKNSAYWLSQFIAQDPEIQKVYNQAFTRAKKRLPINKANDIRISESKGNKSYPPEVTLAELIKDHIDNDSMAGRVLKTVLHISRAFAGRYVTDPKNPNKQYFRKSKDAYLYNSAFTTKTAFVAEMTKMLKSRGASDAYIAEQVQNFMNSDVDGMFMAGVGIYVNPEVLGTPEGAKALGEELIHSIDVEISNLYYGQQKGQLHHEVVKAFDQLERVAMEFSLKLMNEPELAQLVDSIRNDPEFNVDLAYNRASTRALASAANIIYAFQEAPMLQQQDKLTAEQVRIIQRDAMMEFRANLLTDAEMINRAYYQRSNINSHIRNATSQRLLKWLKDKFAIARKLVLKSIGVIDYDHNNDQTNLLADALAAYQTITDHADKIMVINENAGNTYRQGTASLEAAANKNNGGKKGRRKRKGKNRDNFSKPYSSAKLNQSSLANAQANVNSNPNISNEHKAHLNGLLSSYDNAVNRLIPDSSDVFAELKNGYSDEITAIADVPFRDAVDKLTADIRALGINIEPEEQEVMKNIAGIYKANIGLNNQVVISELGKTIDGIISESNNGDFQTMLQAINQSQDPEIKQNFLPIVAAYINTSSVLRNDVSNIINNLPNKGKVKKAIERFTLNPVSLEVSNISNSLEAMDVLAREAAAFDLDTKLRNDERIEQQVANLKRSEVATRMGNAMYNRTGSTKLSTAVKTVMHGQQQQDDLSDYDSAFGKALRELIFEMDRFMGRPTIVSRALRWFLDASGFTNDIYQYLGEKQAITSQLRERMSAVIPQGIRNLYKDSPLTDVENEALNKALLPANLNRIRRLKGLQDSELIQILRSDSTRRTFLDRAKSDLDDAVRSLGLSDNESRIVLNYLLWQAQGLGELSVRKVAKSNKPHEGHNILPNSRAIASLVHLKGMIPDNITQDVAISALKDAVEAVASLKSLEFINGQTKETLADLAEREIDNFKYILDSVDVLEQTAASQFPNSLLGEDGFEHKRVDPKNHIQIVDPSDFDKEDRLKRKGYKIIGVTPTGEYIYQTRMSSSSRYTSGILGFAEYTVGGVSINTLDTLGSHADNVTAKKSRDEVALRDSFYSDLRNAIRDESYYDSLSEDTSKRLVIDATGAIVNEKIDLPKDIEEQFVKTSQRGIDALGNYEARVLEERINSKQNEHYVDVLNAKFRGKQDTSSRNYIKIDGNFQPRSNKPADIAFARRVNNFYDSLPLATKEYIDSKGGLWVDEFELDNIIGYRQASITDMWNGTSTLPKSVQVVVKGMFSILSPLGFSPEKSAKYLETVINESVHFTKDVILNRSIVVAVGNLLSNAIHVVVNFGINPKIAYKDMKEGYLLAKDYEQTARDLVEVQYQLKYAGLSAETRNKLLARQKSLRQRIETNPVTPMVRQGILTSVTAQDIGADPDEFSLAQRAKDKLGISKITGKLEGTPVMNILSNALITQDSKAHEFMVNALDYGDFIAKYAVYKHLTERKAQSKDLAMHIIRSEFINYGMNRGREFDWLNRTGIMWFMAYKLGIQKIIFRNFRKNPLRTLATFAGDKGLHAVWDDKLDLIKTVPSNHLLPYNPRTDFRHGLHFSPTPDASAAWYMQLLNAM